LGAEISQRNNSEGKPFETDEGNFIIDANFGTINNPKALARKLEERAGIIEHGLFIDMADFVVVAEEFECKILEK
jgi:ribose 5-phosphate isomerase A